VSSKKPSNAELAPNMDWQAEDDMNTLMRAHAIRSDAKRHARAKAKAREKLAQMRAVAHPGRGRSYTNDMED
jgi:hypothetical protein